MTKRIEQIRSSKIREMFDKAAKIPNLINLSIGQPNFPVPESIKNTMIDALLQNKTKYTSTAGIEELRQKIIKKYSGKSFAQSAIITSGVSGGIFLSYSAILEEGDELLVLDPYFVMYPDLCSFLNAKPVIVKTNDDFTIDPQELENAITEKTKAIIINSPSNPTGHVLSKEELNYIFNLARKYDLYVLSDEIYESFDYDSKFISAADFDYEKTILLNGFSKNFALAGLRIGYAVGPKDIIDDMTKLQQYTFVCAPSIVQYALAENLEEDITDLVAQFKKKRDYIYENLKDHYKIIKPEGAFYFYIKTPSGMTGEAFSELCLKNNLLVVPASAFSKMDDHIRISYAVDDKTLQKGIEILIKIKEEIINAAVVK